MIVHILSWPEPPQEHFDKFFPLQFPPLSSIGFPHPLPPLVCLFLNKVGDIGHLTMTLYVIVLKILLNPIDSSVWIIFIKLRKIHFLFEQFPSMSYSSNTSVSFFPFTLLGWFLHKAYETIRWSRVFHSLSILASSRSHKTIGTIDSSFMTPFISIHPLIHQLMEHFFQSFKPFVGGVVWCCASNMASRFSINSLCVGYRDRP